MKTIELRDLGVEELHDKLRELHDGLFKLRFQLATGQLDNHRRIREVKRDIARVRTVIREHELALEAEAAATQAAPEGAEEATQ